MTKLTKVGAAEARGAARMAFVNVPDRLYELTAGAVHSMDAARRAEIGSYRGDPDKNQNVNEGRIG